jgi:pimeloyl-ACP methyl ester carboxylesterase
VEGPSRDPVVRLNSGERHKTLRYRGHALGRHEHDGRAGRAFLARLEERTANRDKPVSIVAFIAQLKAKHAWGRQHSADLSRIHHLILVANGDHDKMVPSSNSVDLARRLRTPNSSSTRMPGMGGCLTLFVRRQIGGHG